MNHRFGADILSYFCKASNIQFVKDLFAIYEVRFHGDMYCFPDQTASRFDEIDSCFEVMPFPFPKIGI